MPKRPADSEAEFVVVSKMLRRRASSLRTAKGLVDFSSEERNELIWGALDEAAAILDDAGVVVLEPELPDE